MSAEQNIEIFRRAVDEGFNRGNLAEFDQIVAADLTEHAELPPGLPSGREGVKGLITALRSAFPDLKYTIEDITADHDKVWARLTARGTNTGSFMGAPPTGKPVRVEVIEVARIADGKLIEHWAVADNLGMLKQLGVVSLPWEQAAARR
jgi:steroid delta-isomerase-like uncharacterized protein